MINPPGIAYVEPTRMQRRFLKVLADEVETILTDLEVQVLPVVQQTIDDYSATNVRFVTGHQVVPPVVTVALTSWSKKYGLETPWVVSAAFETVIQWAIEPKVPRIRFEWSVPIWRMVQAGEIVDALFRDIDKARDGADAFEEFVDFVNSISKSSALKPLEKTRRVRFHEKHLSWLVHFQVKGWGYLQIANAERGGRRAPYGDDSGRTTVRNKIHELASEIALPLRPSKVGRPPNPTQASGRAKPR